VVVFLSLKLVIDHLAYKLFVDIAYQFGSYFIGISFMQLQYLFYCQGFLVTH